VYLRSSDQIFFLFFSFSPNFERFCISEDVVFYLPGSTHGPQTPFSYGLSGHWCNSSSALDCVNSSELASSLVSTLRPSRLCTDSFALFLRACPIAHTVTSSLPELNNKAVVAWGVTVMVFLPMSLLLIYIEAEL